MFKVKTLEILSGHTQAVYALCKINEHQFISAGGDGLIVQWDLENPGSGTALAKTPEIIFCADYHQTTNALICGTMTGGIYWLNLDRGSVVKNVLHHVGGTYAVVCHHNTVYTCGADGRITAWNAETAEKAWSIKGSSYGIRCAFFSGTDDKCQHSMNSMFYIAGDQAGHLISGCYFSEAAKNDEVPDNQRFIRATQNEANNTLHYLNAHQQTIFSVLVDEQNNRIYTGGRDAKIKCFSLSSKALIKSVDAHWFTVNKLEEIATHNAIASSSRDKTIRIWDKESLNLLHTIRREDGLGHTHSVNNLLWFASQKLLISCGDDRQIVMYSIQ